MERGFLTVRSHSLRSREISDSIFERRNSSMHFSKFFCVRSLSCGVRRLTISFHVFSMIMSKVQGSGDSSIISFYYKLYNNVIPKVYDFCSKFWAQLSGVAAYAVIARIGKKYCPYLIRWHWTFLLIIMLCYKAIGETTGDIG